MLLWECYGTLQTGTHVAADDRVWCYCLNMWPQATHCRESFGLSNFCLGLMWSSSVVDGWIVQWKPGHVVMSQYLLTVYQYKSQLTVDPVSKRHQVTICMYCIKLKPVWLNTCWTQVLQIWLTSWNYIVIQDNDIKPIEKLKFLC